jgi:hypothetical protein
MLSSISWQQYLAAVVTITVSYYLYIGFRYYQQDITHLFNRKQKPFEDYVGIPPAIYSVMGEAKPDRGISISDAQELIFASASPDEAENLTSKSTALENSGDSLIEPGMELVEEAGSLMEAFKDNDNKPEFLALLKILIGSYKRVEIDIDLSVALKRIVERSKEKLPFPISLTDLQNYWAQ